MKLALVILVVLCVGCGGGQLTPLSTAPLELSFRQPPAAVEVQVGGETRRYELGGVGTLRLELPPGQHQVSIRSVDAEGKILGLTQAEVDLESQPSARIEVAPAPVRSPAVPPPAAAASSAPLRPNIILIVADDMDYFDLSAHGSSVTRTPRLDQLAQQGMSMRNYYASSAKCSPARAALLTSHTPAYFGWTDVISSYPLSDGTYLAPARGLTSAVPTLAEVVSSQGYVTSMVGKWHVGHSRLSYRPWTRGFQEFRTWGSVQGSAPETIGYWGFLLGADTGVFQMPAYGEPGSDEHYLTRELTDQAIDFVTRHQSQRFLLMLNHVSPHLPLHVPAGFDNTATGYDLASNNGKTSAMLTDLDREIGRLVDHVDNLGLGSQTLILVTSDNGGTLVGRTNNAYRHQRVRGAKGQVFEGGIRVPMLARWTGTIPANVLNNTVCSHLDVLPTAAALVGAPAPAGIEGRSLVDNLVSNRWTAAPDLFWVAPRFSSYQDFQQSGATFDELDQAAIRSGNMKVVRDTLLAAPRLYDVSGPVREMTNLASGNPALTQELMARWKDWHARIGLVDLQLASVGPALVVPFDARLDFVDGDFTFCLDVQTSNLTQNRVLAERPGCWELTWVQDRVRLKLYDDKIGTLAERAVYLETGPLAAGQVHRVAFTVYGQTWKGNRLLTLYADGSVAQRLTPDAYPPGKSFAAAVPSDAPIALGSRTDGTGRFLGTLTNPRISTLALPGDEL